MGDSTQSVGASPVPSTTVVVEGVSDKLALEQLAGRFGRDLASEGVSILPIGGAHAIGRFLREAASGGKYGRLAGLCDSGEGGEFQRALEAAGLGSNLTPEGMERLGFFVCVTDLEDELIRALGADSVVMVVEAQGEINSLIRFQAQPAHRGRDLADQLHLFMRTRAGRKAQYARALVDALDLDRVPRPLVGLLEYIRPHPNR